mmetsp:Transcript_9240/g.15537  ORF Transcript_9240/g.15537 Transcript_9240/m.15537 type:complete len:91 (+) Transcript_9240:86-358(+)
MHPSPSVEEAKEVDASIALPVVEAKKKKATPAQLYVLLAQTNLVNLATKKQNKKMTKDWDIENENLMIITADLKSQDTVIQQKQTALSEL